MAIVHKWSMHKAGCSSKEEHPLPRVVEGQARYPCWLLPPAHSSGSTLWSQGHTSLVLSFSFQTHSPPKMCFVVDTEKRAFVSSLPTENHIICYQLSAWRPHRYRSKHHVIRNSVWTLKSETVYELWKHSSCFEKWKLFAYPIFI